MASFFLELSLVMILTLIVSIIINKLKQPLLIGYIITGILSGPLFFNILGSTEGYQTYAHMGIALLLFIVGLHLNLKLIKEIGFISGVVGFAQILITTLFGFLISYFFKIDIFISFLIGIALSFSSTIIIVKLLSDKKEMEKIHGKIALGVLIVQDLVAVIMLMVLSAVANSEGTNMTIILLKTFVYGLLSVSFILLFSKFVLNKLLDSIAKSQDLLFIFVISWVLGISALFVYLGFSVEIGALLAGVALASSPYQYEISSKMKPLRDFFIVMFFILLGSQMIPTTDYLGGNSFEYIAYNFSDIFIPAVVLSIFILIIKPLIVFVILNIMGFHSKPSFMAGLSLGQVSEFSLIMIMIAQQLKIVTPQIVSLVTLVAIITITFSTYFIMHSQTFYLKLKRFLQFLEIRKPKTDIEKKIKEKSEILVFGYDRIGYSLLKTLKKLKKKYIVVDYNPNIIKRLERNKISCIYGDANDIDFVNEFDLESLDIFISTIAEIETNMLLLKEFKKRNKQATIILSSNQIDDALELYKEGADYVILPNFLGGDYVSTLIENYAGDISNLLSEKIKHINDLKEISSFNLNLGDKIK